MLYTILGKLHDDVLMGRHYRAPIVNFREYSSCRYKKMYFLVYDNRDIPSEVSRIKKERLYMPYRAAGSGPRCGWHECYIISTFPFHKNEEE